MRTPIAFLLLWTLAFGKQATAQTLKIGLSLSFQGGDADWSASQVEVVNLRLQELLDLNAKYPVVSQLRAPGAIQIVTDDCSANRDVVDVSSAIGSAIRQSSSVNGLIGVGYSEQTGGFVSAAQVFNLPVCDGGSTSPSLSDKGLYPNFFRTLPNDNMAGEAIIGLVYAQGFHQVAVISSLDSYGVGLAASVRGFAQEYNVTLLASQSYIPDTGDFVPVMDAIEASGATIILFLGLHTDLLRALAEADRRGMDTAGFQWITGDDALYTDPNALTPYQRQLFNGVWASFPKEGTGQAWDDFVADWRTTHDADPQFYSGFYAGCVEAYVWAYDQALRNGTSWADLASNTAYLTVPSDLSFPDRVGVTGPLALDENGDRVAAYELFYFDASAGNGSFTAFGNWTGINEKLFSQYVTPVYFAGAATKPADSLEVIKEYRTVAWGSGTGIFIIVLSFLCLLATSSIAAFVYKERDNGIFKPLSPSFLLTTLMGTALVSFYPLTLLGTPSTASCAAPVFIIPLALSLVLGSLVVKTYRLFRIFRSQGFSTTSLKNSRMFFMLLGCSVLFMILSMVWTGADAPKPQWYLQQKVSRTYEIFDYSCRSDSESIQWIFLGLNYICIVTLLLYGAFLCWVNRNLPKKFGESKAIGTLFYIYIASFVAILIVIFVLGLDTPALVVVKTIATAGVVAATLGVLFVKNCYLAWSENQKSTSAELLATGVGLMSGKRKNSAKTSTRNEQDEVTSNLAVKSSAKNATKTANVFVASKQSFMTVWLPKQLILYGDKGFALIVSSSDGDPTVNSNSPTCIFILLSEYTCASQANEERDVFCMRLSHKKDKTATFLIRVESQKALDDWQKSLAPYARTGLSILSSIGGTSAQRGAAIATAAMDAMDEEI
ncbi:hypothetical protein HDU87_008756 [Geranomyces variabilis]|uniref:G-protein coupled receptors family 3 profile domain-containing protein n=1 Tax=Geranomyces variabilis TaxID=109894 RepID=A0AAD5TCG6_9FUNG|nr:hypothetical protein HDU87_008756 [Geranomyces variabilis]